MRNRTLALLALACAATIGTGLTCIPRAASPTGTLKVLITDKAYPFEFISEAIVTITRVQVRQGATDGSTTEDDSSFVTIFEDSQGKEFNLVALQNGETDLLADAQVPVGTYTQMRLVITGGQVKLTNDEVFNLTVPSGATSGLKLNATFEVAEGQITQLLMDFDLSRAFDVIPGSAVDNIDAIQEFRFSPSLQGAIRLVQTAATGQIAGVVTAAAATDPIASAAVTAFDASNNEVTTTATDENGVYLLSGLPAGTYTVEFSASGYQTTQVAGIVVTAGQTTEDVNAALAVEPPAP
jgi:hypothetical protein